jgi:chromosome segregation ATPase
MTSIGFFFHRIAWQIGLRRERARWAAVNRETAILSEAEDLLGRLAWRDVQEIDELSGEYWQIRDISDQQEKLRDATKAADSRNEQLKDQFDSIQDGFDDKIDELKATKNAFMDEALTCMREIESMKVGKDATKRKFTVLKDKIKVLKKQPEDLSAEEEKTRGMIEIVRQSFDRDVAAIAERGERITRLEGEVEKTEKLIATEKENARQATADLQAEISKLSKRIAEYSAKIGGLENAKVEFHQTIGHYLSNHMDGSDAVVHSVLRKFGSLSSKIRHLRQSIAYNQRLARRSL